MPAKERGRGGERQGENEKEPAKKRNLVIIWRLGTCKLFYFGITLQILSVDGVVLMHSMVSLAQHINIHNDSHQLPFRAVSNRKCKQKDDLTPYSITLTRDLQTDPAAISKSLILTGENAEQSL